MDLFSSKGVKTSKNIIERKVYNFYKKKMDFINNPTFYSDFELLNILKLNYLNYGIICSSLIENNYKDELYFINDNIFGKFVDSNIEIISPSNFLTGINSIIEKLKNIVNFIENTYEEINDKDIKIVKKIGNLRNNDYMKYLNYLVDLNNLRLMINRIYFDYYQDLNYYLNKLNQIKYDFFVTENNILFLIESYYKIKYELNNIMNEEFYLLTKNNSDKYKIKEINGTINYKIFLNIIDNSIENI